MIRIVRHPRRAFTLIELLTVIGIIVILVAILLPVISTVRTKAFRTDTLAELSSIVLACSNYYTDYSAYPGPIADASLYGYKNLTPAISIPGVTTTTPASQTITKITSSQNMVLGLAGGLVLLPNGTINYDQTQIIVGPQSLNAASPKAQVSYYTPKASELSTNSAGAYVSGAVYATPFVVPEFLDHYPTPHPIVYLRAIRGATYMCDDEVVTNPGATTPPLATVGPVPTAPTTPISQYYSKEMAPYWVGSTSGGVTATPGTVFPSMGDPNVLNNGVKVQLYTGTGSGSSASSGIYGEIQFFQNPSLNDGLTPRNKDSFILFSSGLDGIYGTTDDIIYSQ